MGIWRKTKLDRIHPKETLNLTHPRKWLPILRFSGQRKTTVGKEEETDHILRNSSENHKGLHTYEKRKKIQEKYICGPIPSFYRWKNLCPKRVGDLPKVLWQVADIGFWLKYSDSKVKAKGKNPTLPKKGLF